MGAASRGALLGSMVHSLAALLVLGSKVFTLRHLDQKAGLKLAGIGALAAGVRYGFGPLRSAA